jgi:sugar lactone lactonase YvrE
MIQRVHLRLAALALLASAGTVPGATGGPESLPNPYHLVKDYFQMPPGRKWGQVASVDVDPKGNIWIFERCGDRACNTSTEDAIFEFDQSGKYVKSFGSKMFFSPHGITVDDQGYVWVTDAEDGPGAKGHQVFKFNQDGKLLMTLGKAGVPGTTNDTFNRPSDVAIARNGDIFVADGHGDASNARIVKFNKDGKFIKTWGTKGSAPGQFDLPHALAIDSKGRLFVADRNNNRIQIFTPDGKYITEWKQFGRPSGIYIDKHDVIYVADSESNNPRNPGFKRGIYVGSAKDGKVTAFIPNYQPDDPDHTNTSFAEGVAADAQGNIYGAEVGGRTLSKFVRN